MRNQTRKLRELIARPGAIASIGVWDCYSASVAAAAGFEVISILGSMVTWSAVGKPDLGYVTQTEMVEATRRITSVVDLPAFVDCDDGFGESVHIQRTIRLLEQAGAAGMFMEDTARPTSAHDLKQRTLIGVDSMEAKIRAAVDARLDPDFVIVARTDNHQGLDELIRRAVAYRNAGADMVLTIGLRSEEDMRTVARGVPGPLIAVQSLGGKAPQVPHAELQAMGYKVVSHVLPLFSASAYAMREAATGLRQAVDAGAVAPTDYAGLSRDEIQNTVGLAEAVEAFHRYQGA